MAEIRQDEYMVEIDHVDGSIISSAYAREIPDFTNTTVEQVDEWTGAGTCHEYTQVVDQVITSNR